MRQFFVESEQVGAETIRIVGEDARHIGQVLRMKSGEQLRVSDRQGRDFFCQVEQVEREAVTVRILYQDHESRELPVRISLFQGLPKGDKMELVIQKAVELGASEVVPVRSRRCVVKLDAHREAKKLARWRAIAESAAKQSGRGILPQIHDSMDFGKALEYAQELDSVLIPYELCDAIDESQHIVQRAVRQNSIGIFIGPEGGFERSEVEAAVRSGAQPVSLGKRILRTETAGLAVLSVLMFLIEWRK